MTDLTGQILAGQYRLDALIGTSSMATVYRARQTSTERDVAIKVMAPELAKNQEFVARFEREAWLMAVLQHPHIVPVFSFGVEGEHTYIVMRYIQGSILSERLLKPPLTLREVKHFLTQIASAVEYAHSQGVVHRDLEPTNVLLDEQDNVYLTDFGIAKMLAGSTKRPPTATGHVMGTPAYMAPEQWLREPVDTRADVYALGIMLFEMLMGTPPFRADTPYALMYKHMDMPPPFPSVLNPDLPEEIEQIILRALAKKAADRYPSAQQMADDFAAAVRAMSPNAVKKPLPRVTPEEITNANQITLARLQSVEPIVFLSYDRNDVPIVQQIRDRLSTAKFDVWTDEKLVAGTPAWERKIEAAIKESKVLLVLLSPDARDSEWVMREVGFAEQLGITIIPVLIRGENDRDIVPLRLTNHQRIDARADFDAAMQQLVAAIRDHLD